jgi:hypothetical protein
MRGDKAMSNVRNEVRKSEDKVMRHKKKELVLEKAVLQNQEEKYRFHYEC